MPLTRYQAEAIRDWVPYPSSLSSSVESPTVERFLSQWASSPTPSDSNSEAPWTRAGLSYLRIDDLAEIAGAVIRAQIPPALCPTPASLEIIKGLLSKLFDYGAPLKIFACAGALLAYLPRTEEFAEQWRLMRPANPPVAFWDADDPEGLDIPSNAGSPHRLPSYHPPEPRTPAHRAELLVLVALCAAARAYGSPLRPSNEVDYWSLGVASGRWSIEQFFAADQLMHTAIWGVLVPDAAAEAIRDEMERIGELEGKLFRWF